MKRLFLHNILIERGGLRELEDLKDLGVRFIAMDNDGEIYAYTESPEYLDTKELPYWDSIVGGYYLTKVDIISIEPSKSLEEIDWDYLEKSGEQPEPEKVDVELKTLKQIYQALFSGHIIKSSGDITDHDKYIRYSESKDEIQYSADSINWHYCPKVNELFYSEHNEIYVGSSERLWIYYDYNRDNGITYMDTTFVPIDQERTDEYGYKWVKTEEVR